MDFYTPIGQPQYPQMMHQRLIPTVKRLSLYLTFLAWASLFGEVIPLDLDTSYNYDAYISQAEASHATLYSTPSTWGLADRLVSSVFGEHSPGTANGRTYCWDDQSSSGLPADGEIVTGYGVFHLSTARDAEPSGGYTQSPAGAPPLLPIASNAIRAYRPHSGATGNPQAVAYINLPASQCDYYDDVNFLFSGNNKKSYIYADYDNGSGGIDTELIYESPGAPKSSSEKGFPELSYGTSTNPDVVSALSMSTYWSQYSNYSSIRAGAANIWTFANALPLNPNKELIGFTLAVHDEDAWRSREAVIYAASANNVTNAIHVDVNHGSDINGDGTANNPFETLQHALSICSGGETIALHDGSYGDIILETQGDLFNDWVTIKAAPNATPELGRFELSGPMGPPEQTGGYDAYIRLENLILRDGWSCKGGRHWGLYQCLVERIGPWTGSVDNIEKTAIGFRNGTDITIEGCEITNTGTGIGGRGHEITVRGNYIHDGTHDGIRVVSWWNSLVEDNIICRFDDGVSDNEADWNRHCDLIHIFIPGPGLPGTENNNVTFRYNVLYDTEAQAVQFNNYYGNPDLHNKNIVFEHNIFGPANDNCFNNAEATDGLIIRHNTVCYFPGGRTFGRWTLDNYTFRIGPSTDVEIYNNNLVTIDIYGGAEIDVFDWNIIKNAPALAGVDEKRAYGRFTQIGVDYQLADPSNFDGELLPASPAINAGTFANAPSPLPGEAINGALLDIRPDIGAWEKPGETPNAEPTPTIFNDTKTIFVDDFEDGHYNDVDPWLNDVSQQGLSWYRPAGYDAYRAYVKLSDGLTRQALFSPYGASGQQRVCWLISEQGDNWAEYDLKFSAHNEYLASGSGVTVLTADEDNAYWLDIGKNSGRLIRILNGTEEVLTTSTAIKMPNSGTRDYLVKVRQSGAGITIEVDADQNGSIDLAYTDDDPAAMAALTSGGIGIHDDTDAHYHHIQFDDFEVNVVSFAP